LQGDFKVVVSLGGGEAGDQFKNIRLYAERFVTGDSGYLLGVVERGGPEWQELVETTAVLG